MQEGRKTFKLTGRENERPRKEQRDKRRTPPYHNLPSSEVGAELDQLGGVGAWFAKVDGSVREINEVGSIKWEVLSGVIPRTDITTPCSHHGQMH